MLFNISRRKGKVVHTNFRGEKHGKTRVPAADMTLLFPIVKSDAEMLAPLANDISIYDVFYDDKGNLIPGFLSPLTVGRTPSNISFTLWDKPTNDTNNLKFEGCTIKDIEILFNDKKNIMCKLKVQLHDNPEKDTARLRRLMDVEVDLELLAEQQDFFEPNKPKEAKPAKEAKADAAPKEDKKPAAKKKVAVRASKKK